jgi:FkbM family methyltransferase
LPGKSDSLQVDLQPDLFEERKLINQYIEQIAKFSNIEPVVSVEIGALDGQYTRLLGERFGLAEENTYLIEPNPALHAQLVAAFPGAQKLPCAIAKVDGWDTLNRVVSEKANEVGSSSLKTRTDQWSGFLTYERVVVATMTGESLCGLIKRPIDLCIVDVEGGAYEVLESFGDDLSQVGSLMVECEHAPLFEGQHLYPDVERLLVGSGFKQMAFQYSYAHQSDSIWIQQELIDFMKGWP